MPKFVLASRGSLGATPEDFYTTEAGWVEPSSTPSSPTSSGSIFGNLFSALTRPETVTATLNKYVFGQSAPIPTATNLPTTLPAPSLIAGIPDSYLMIAGAAVLFMVISKRGRR